MNLAGVGDKVKRKGKFFNQNPQARNGGSPRPRLDRVNRDDSIFGQYDSTPKKNNEVETPVDSLIIDHKRPGDVYKDFKEQLPVENQELGKEPERKPIIPNIGWDTGVAVNYKPSAKVSGRPTSLVDSKHFMYLHEGDTLTSWFMSPSERACCNTKTSRCMRASGFSVHGDWNAVIQQPTKTMFRTPPKDIPRIVFTGNPGSGKSTILNSIIGKKLYQSGASLGGGKTKNATYYKYRGRLLTDTPGLSDAEDPDDACKQLQSALSNIDSLRMVHVITLEGGSVRQEDLFTLRLVVMGLRAAGVKEPRLYSLIFNKCAKSVMQAVKKKELMHNLMREFKGIGRIDPDNIIMIPMENFGDEDEQGLLESVANSNSLASFIDNTPRFSTANRDVEIAVVRHE